MTLSHATTNTGNSIRGGSWYNYPENVRCSNRSSGAPGGRDDNIGFRLSRMK